MAHAPVKVITVEREYGSRGGEFAHDLAKHLGWRLLDAELVAGAARMAGVDPKMAAKLDERLDPWYYRYGKMFWKDPVYAPATTEDEKIFDSEHMLELIRKEILAAAHEGNCVLVGRGAACVLAGKPGCFHIFVYATASAKKDWFAHAFPEPGAGGGAKTGGVRPAARGGDPQVLPAGMVLARALSHAAEFLHRDPGDDRRGAMRGGIVRGCAGVGGGVKAGNREQGPGNRKTSGASEVAPATVRFCEDLNASLRLRCAGRAARCA